MIPFDSFYIDTIDLLSKDKKNITSLMSLKTSFEWKIIYENIDLIDDDNIRAINLKHNIKCLIKSHDASLIATSEYLHQYSNFKKDRKIMLNSKEKMDNTIAIYESFIEKVESNLSYLNYLKNQKILCL